MNPFRPKLCVSTVAPPRSTDTVPFAITPAAVAFAAADEYRQVIGESAALIQADGLRLPVNFTQHALDIRCSARFGRR